MIKNLFLCMMLAATAMSASAQSAAAMTRAAPVAAPADAASASAKHKWIKNLKARHPAASAVDPEASTFKKGGQ
jgi:hypothetical protein